MLAPERRTRSDLVAAAVIVVILVVTVSVVWLRSDARGTTSVIANNPLAQQNAAVAPPATLTEKWRADSGVTASPVTTGSSIITADHGTVSGRDPRDGSAVWAYSRDMPLCDVVGAWNTAVAVYRDQRGCSQVTELDGSTGVRKAQRSSDADEAVDLVSDGTYVSSRGATRMELWRSDMVRTLEYGRVDAPVNPGSQPRSGCTLLSSATSTSRVAVLERCPGEPSARLSTLNPAPKDAQAPEEYGSSVLTRVGDGTDSIDGATVLVTSGDRIAVAIPAGITTPASIGIYDGNANPLSAFPIPDAVSPLPGASMPSTADGAVSKTASVYTWWTGTGVLALDLTSLELSWSLPGALGAGTVMGGRSLVPVPGALAVIETSTGAISYQIPVDRGDWTGPVTVAVIGDVVVEQRGSELVALS